MTQRARGTGSVFPYQGGWRAVVTLTDPATGHRIQRTAKTATKAAARERLRSLMRDLEEPRERRTDQLRGYLATWLDEKRRSVRVTTAGSYSTTIRLHVEPYLGDFRLVAIRPAEVRDWQSRLAAANVGTRTMQLAYDILRDALGAAAEDGLIPSNPVTKTERPLVPKREAASFLPAQVAAILEAASYDDEVGPIIMLAAATGARLGEVLGARLDDFDLHASTWTIRRTLIRVPRSERRDPAERFRLGETKSAAGERTVPVPETVRALIAERRGATTTSLMVFHRDGRFIDPRFVSDRWHGVLRRAGVQPVGFHALRHAVASQLLRDRVDVRTVAELLGHDPSILLSTYAHVIDEQRHQAMAGLARSFGLGQ